jgi:hypothetical protein
MQHPLPINGDRRSIAFYVRLEYCDDGEHGCWGSKAGYPELVCGG